jgi:hypothetical protein
MFTLSSAHYVHSPAKRACNRRQSLSSCGLRLPSPRVQALQQAPDAAFPRGRDHARSSPRIWASSTSFLWSNPRSLLFVLLAPRNARKGIGPGHLTQAFHHDLGKSPIFLPRNKKTNGHSGHSALRPVSRTSRVARSSRNLARLIVLCGPWIQPHLSAKLTCSERS